MSLQGRPGKWRRNLILAPAPGPALFVCDDHSDEEANGDSAAILELLEKHGRVDVKSFHPHDEWVAHLNATHLATGLVLLLFLERKNRKKITFVPERCVSFRPANYGRRSAHTSHHTLSSVTDFDSRYMSNPTPRHSYDTYENRVAFWWN